MNDDEKNIAHQRIMFEMGEQKRVLKLIAERAAADRTLRNQFAAAALTGVLANPNSSYHQTKDLLNIVFLFANEALAESKK